MALLPLHWFQELAVGSLTFAICLIILWRIHWFRSLGLSVQFIAAAFGLRIVAGIVSLGLQVRLYGGGDALDYWVASAYLAQLFNKGEVITYMRMVWGPNVTPPPPELKPHAFAVDFWKDDGAYLLIRFHALLRLISQDTLSAHLILYNFLCLIGMLFLYRCLACQVPDASVLLRGVLFFYPTALFWTANMHKEGLALAALGILLHAVMRPVGQIRFVHLPAAVLAALLCVWLRNFWLLLLLPPLIAWHWINLRPQRIGLKYAAVVFAFLALGFFAAQILWSVTPFQLLAAKQQEFSRLSADSRVGSLPVITNGWITLFKQLPLALLNSLLEPLPRVGFKVHYTLAFLDNLFVVGAFLVSLFFYSTRKTIGHRNFFWFASTFSLLLLILIGLTVPFAGAIVRYKVAASVFVLLAASVLITDRFCKSRACTRRMVEA
ncbi:MAG: hypothetical protein NZL95_03115 [Chitinophagales bacterium]|nr:hypothetical protein [Chitinophagales bacterium]MDW8427521.1 hypothetical protein [Chitinophagales bacterium]